VNTLHTRIIERSSFLRSLLTKLVSRLLHLSDYPFLRSDIAILMRERDLRLNSEDILGNALEDIHEFLRLIEPTNLRNLQLVRIGSRFDGGYVVPKNFLIEKTWMTFGLGQNVDFENNLVESGCIVTSFDHTLPGRPLKLDSRVHWFNLGISSATTSSMITLETAVEKAVKGKDWCLKSDIEGSEWSFLPQLLDISNLPEVLVLELHKLLELFPENCLSKKLLTLRKLILQYEVVHVNVNNFAPVFQFDNLVMPDVLEVTMVKRSCVAVDENFGKESKLPFSEQLSPPNNPRHNGVKLRFPRVK